MRFWTLAQLLVTANGCYLTWSGGCILGEATDIWMGLYGIIMLVFGIASILVFGSELFDKLFKE